MTAFSPHFFLLTLAVSWGATAYESSPLETLSKNYKRLVAKKSVIEASFRQIPPRIRGEDKDLPLNGKVTFELPGKMKWVYQTPKEKIWMNDGEWIWHIDKKENVEQKLPASRDKMGMGFLWGTGELTAHFDVVKSTKNSRTTELDLKPKVADHSLKALRLTFENRRKIITKVEMTDAFGGVNTIEFSNITIGSKISP